MTKTKDKNDTASISELYSKIKQEYREKREAQADSDSKPTGKWYLRHADFRPEQLRQCDTLGFLSNDDAVEALTKAGNIFFNEEAAVYASERVRAVLAAQYRFRADIETEPQAVYINREPMPGFEYLTIGRVQEILKDIQRLAGAYGYSTTDRDKVCDLIGKVLSGWEMEFRLRHSAYLEKLKENDSQDTPSPASTRKNHYSYFLIF